MNGNSTNPITIRQLRDRGEQGFAMVTMLLVMVIVSALVVVMLATQNHTANTTVDLDDIDSGDDFDPEVRFVAITVA